MPRIPKRKAPLLPPEPQEFGRIARPLSLSAQVEQILRQGVAEKRWARGRLPTEVELAEQLGVSRETVRLAAEVLQREGLLVKIRRKGTFTTTPQKLLQLKAAEAKLLGYLQIDHRTMTGQEDAANRAISGLMLQGAIEEAGNKGFRLVVQRAPHTHLREAFFELYQHTQMSGVIFASYGEEKLLRRIVGLGLPALLLDHDLHLARVNSVRDDSFEDARRAVQYLASLGHRRIAFAHWQQTDLNPWRLRGYRQGLRDVNLPRHRRWEILTDLTENGARQVVQTWLGLTPRPTAIYCFNNTLARFLMDELRPCGQRVPQHLSIMGAGGEEIPGLSCTQVNWYQMGQTAVQIMLRAVADPKRHAPEHAMAPHAQLQVGQTTAPPCA
jgi:DNA-binding LacI/PurR family transcriptional regulator